MPLPPPAIAAPVEGLAEHKHCEACGKSIGLTGRVCSPECVERFQEGVRLRKRSVYMVMGAVALVLLFSVYGGKLLGMG